MTRRRVISGILLAGSLCAAMYAASVHAYTTGFGQAVARTSVSGASHKIDVLWMLRRGDTDAAIASLESSLDGDIVSYSLYDAELDDWLNRFPDSTRATHRLMECVAGHRKVFPSPMKNPTLKAAIDQELKKYQPRCEPPRPSN